MATLLAEIKHRFPELQFTAGEQFCWSPETKEVFYNANKDTDQLNWSLLHETAHALLEHKTYQADFELIRLEVAAWEKARELGKELGVEIDEDHIQDCLDTYRDWLYRRSICPTCTTKCLQQSDYSHYRCFNCHTVWRVTPSRFCRTYRSTKKIAQESESAIFHPSLAT